MAHSPEHDGILGRDVPDDHRSSGPVPAALGIVGCVVGKDRHGPEAILRRGAADWRRRCAGMMPRDATTRAAPLLVAMIQSSDGELARRPLDRRSRWRRALGAGPAPLARAARPGSLPGRGSLERAAIDYPPDRLARASGEALG